MNLKRVRLLNGEQMPTKGPILYWMSRDQRVHDNWALIYAQLLAQQHNSSVGVVFSLVKNYLEAPRRHYDFMLGGLEEVEVELSKLKIPFILLQGNPSFTIPHVVEEYAPAALVTDFSPLKAGRAWRKSIAENVDIPFYEVDAHNIVPTWIASNKQEYAARTIRPKINKALPEFLEEFPPISDNQNPWPSSVEETSWEKVRNNLTVDRSVPPVTWIRPGASNACRTLEVFIDNRLTDYDQKRNDPNANVQSNLSPYLHFGQISAQRIALTVDSAGAIPREVRDVFLEELIVRKELSDNYCFFNPAYDSVEGFPNWAKETLAIHQKDRREFLYSPTEFEEARTHDELWNAAQTEMATTGKMHGYIRMYWAKKLLEWTDTPEAALKLGIYLNDKYELDGRDPNGYVGMAWSVGGVHDRPWFERPIFGKVRYMNYNGAKRKFKVDAYVQRFLK